LRLFRFFPEKWRRKKKKINTPVINVTKAEEISTRFAAGTLNAKAISCGNVVAMQKTTAVKPVIAILL
jgi:hypothetical protein